MLTGYHHINIIHTITKIDKRGKKTRKLTIQKGSARKILRFKKHDKKINGAPSSICTLFHFGFDPKRKFPKYKQSFVQRLIQFGH